MFLLYKNSSPPEKLVELAPGGRHFKPFNEEHLMTVTQSNTKDSKKRLPGRPKKTVKKSDMLMVRMTPTERMLIESKSKAAGLKPSEWCRKAAKGAKVIPRFSAEEVGWFRALSGLSNNLNQLTHLAHVSGLFSLGIKCRALLVQIESLLTKISNHDR